jgi:hypothetical protein
MVGSENNSDRILHLYVCPILILISIMTLSIWLIECGTTTLPLALLFPTGAMCMIAAGRNRSIVLLSGCIASTMSGLCWYVAPHLPGSTVVLAWSICACSLGIGGGAGLLKPLSKRLF